MNSPASHGPRTAGGLVADLTYLNYTFNRERSPHITPERWKKVYGPNVDAMEARFQAEQRRAA